jgi:hypothetical protein
MSIPANYDNLLLDRRCVAAYFYGHMETLLREVHLTGYTEITLEDLLGKAELYHEAWLIGDDSKTSCYLCRRELTPGKLCVCFDRVIAKRHYNVHEPRLLAKLAPDEIVETYVCKDCGELADTTAQSALSMHDRFKCYSPREQCRDCHKKRRPRKHRPPQQKLEQRLVADAEASMRTGEA